MISITGSRNQIDFPTFSQALLTLFHPTSFLQYQCQPIAAAPTSYVPPLNPALMHLALSVNLLFLLPLSPFSKVYGP